MKISNKFKGAIAAILTVGFLGASDLAFAQTTPPQTQQQQVKTDFTDKELKQFIEANTRLMSVQQESEKAMLAILNEEKLSIEKFNTMAMAHQQQKLNEVGATAEEMAAFNKAAERMMELQPAMQKQAETAIAKGGMKLELYEQIMLAYQQNPAVQEKINKMMMEQQK